LPPDQRAHPGGQIIRGGDGASGREGIGRILCRVVIGLERSRLGRSLKIGWIGRIHQSVFMRKLNETGPMSREELVDMAVKEGFFPDPEKAVQGVHPMLVSLLRSELIRELPDGKFAPPTMSQAIKLRRVV
jgi:hypothetical protein